MICEEFDKLTPKEKTEYIGQVVHSIQSDPALFEMGKEIIRIGTIKGLFDRVTILPDNTKRV
jgi:hypothetical protein